MRDCWGKEKKYLTQGFLPFVIITGCAALLVVRCFYSFCWSDEGFYLSLVHRFWLGDRPFVDEWSGAQLYAVILLPVYHLYRSLVGSSDGVYLFFRIFMVICNYILCLYIFISIRKRHNSAAALAGALLFLFYTRANIQGASYYSVSLFFFLWSICLIYNYKSGENNRVRLFMAGCNMSMAVLGNPYLVLYYAIFGIAVIFIEKYRKCIKGYLVVCTGTLFCACCYMAFILSRISLQELFEYFSYIFQDPEHTSMNLIVSVILWFVRIIYRYFYVVPLWGLIFIFLFRNKRNGNKVSTKLMRGIIYLSIFIFGINLYLSRDMIGCINIALSTMMLLLFILLPEQKRREMERDFRVIFLPGIFYSVAWHMLSNTGLDSMAIGFAVCAVIAPAVIQEAYLELEMDSCRKYRWLRALPIVIAVAAILQTGYLRLFSVYRDDEIWKMDTRVDKGPAKYLYTTGEHYRQYEEIVDTLTTMYNKENEGRIVITELVPWAYLCVDALYGSPSPCRFSGGLNEERLKNYYTLMPDKMPEFIMAVNPKYGNFKSSLIQGNEEVAAPNGTGVADWLLEEAERLGYHKLDKKCGSIYIK